MEVIKRRKENIKWVEWRLVDKVYLIQKSRDFGEFIQLDLPLAIIVDFTASARSSMGNEQKAVRLPASIVPTQVEGNSITWKM